MNHVNEAREELIQLSGHLAEAVKRLSAYERGDRRQAVAVWELLWEADEALDRARTHVAACQANSSIKESADPEGSALSQ